MRDKRSLPGFNAGLYFSRSLVAIGSSTPPAPGKFLLSMGEVLMSDKALTSIGRELVDTRVLVKESLRLNEHIKRYEKKLGMSRFKFSQLTRDKIMKEYVNEREERENEQNKLK